MHLFLVSYHIIFPILNIKVEADKKLNPKIKKVLPHKKNTHLNFCHVYILKAKELYYFGDSKSPFNLISFKAPFLLNKIHKYSTTHSWHDDHSTNVSVCRVFVECGGRGRKTGVEVSKRDLYTHISDIVRHENYIISSI